MPIHRPLLSLIKSAAEEEVAAYTRGPGGFIELRKLNQSNAALKVEEADYAALLILVNWGGGPPPPRP